MGAFDNIQIRVCVWRAPHRKKSKMHYVFKVRRRKVQDDSREEKQ